MLTELSVAEYAMLVRGGFEPLGIVAWSAVFFTSYVYGGMMGGGGAMTMGVQNFELREFTQAMYSAREAVMQRISRPGLRARRLRRRGRERSGTPSARRRSAAASACASCRGLMVTFTAVGTAIREDADTTVDGTETSSRPVHLRRSTNDMNERETPYDPSSLEGVPEAGRARLQQNRQGLFTSDLSVNEFLLVKQAGFEPLGLVVGSSIYHIGIQMAGWKKSQEMTVLSEAMYGARQLAMTRMEEEADQLGADGVVGVRLDIGRYEWGQDMAEFIAIGTAVKHREGVMHRAPNGRPFTSDLSGQDFWTLLRTGPPARWGW